MLMTTRALLMDLPEISRTPSQHADCCVSLSSSLLSTLRDNLPCSPSIILSIGSGRGLLEALILHDHSDLELFGVEVSTQVNQYLLQDRLHVVNGTWDLDPTAWSAQAWVFVYPREPRLLWKYLANYGLGSVRKIIWLGPRADLKEYETIVEKHQANWVKKEWEDCGLVSYEALMIWTKPS